MTYQSEWRLEHESFLQPENGSVRVWRYLDLARLVAVLMKAELPLIRMDLLKDGFEGSLTRGAYETWSRNGDWANGARTSKFRPQFRREVYVSSWHANDAESEAMWRLYCGPNEGVALQTTYEKFDRSLPWNVLLGRMQYLDYDASEEPPAWYNMLTAVMQKRSAFEHEREVRAVVWRRPSLLATGVKIEDLPTDEPPSIGVPWIVGDVLEAIYISPYAEAWYEGVVLDVITRFAPSLIDRVRWSKMKGVPRF